VGEQKIQQGNDQRDDPDEFVNRRTRSLTSASATTAEENIARKAHVRPAASAHHPRTDFPPNGPKKDDRITTGAPNTTQTA